VLGRETEGYGESYTGESLGNLHWRTEKGAVLGHVSHWSKWSSIGGKETGGKTS